MLMHKFSLKNLLISPIVSKNPKNILKIYDFKRLFLEKLLTNKKL